MKESNNNILEENKKLKEENEKLKNQSITPIFVEEKKVERRYRCFNFKR